MSFLRFNSCLIEFAMQNILGTSNYFDILKVVLWHKFYFPINGLNKFYFTIFLVYF